MQKRSNQSQGAPAGSILISFDDLNSPVSIKRWIKEVLEYKYSEPSNEAIIEALEGILKDHIFINQPDEKKSEFISKINELIQKLRNEKI